MPKLPGLTLWETIIVNDQFCFRVDGVLSIVEAEFKQLGFGDCFGGASFDTQVAVDAAKVVDFLDVSVTLPW